MRCPNHLHIFIFINILLSSNSNLKPKSQPSNWGSDDVKTWQKVPTSPKHPHFASASWSSLFNMYYNTHARTHTSECCTSDIQREIITEPKSDVPPVILMTSSNFKLNHRNQFFIPEQICCITHHQETRDGTSAQQQQQRLIMSFAHSAGWSFHTRETFPA